MENLYKVTDETGRNFLYIRAEKEENAMQSFQSRYSGYTPKTCQKIEKPIHAVYFSDSPYDPAYFSGTKTDATKAARLYIRQWKLDAKIDRIETL